MEPRSLALSLILATAMLGCGKRENNKSIETSPTPTDTAKEGIYGTDKLPPTQGAPASAETKGGLTDTSPANGPEIAGGSPRSLVDQATKLASLCAADMAATCEQLKSEIGLLNSQREQAMKERDYIQLQRKNLKLSYSYELLALYAKSPKSSAGDFASLNKTYANLKEILEYQIGMQLPIKPYSPGELAVVNEVFTDFGDLYIKASPLDADSFPVNTIFAMTGQMPWSGYWFPKRDKTVFDGPNSPLGKLDQLLVKKGKAPGTVNWEKGHYDGNAAEWEGACDAWAIASIKTKEPQTAFTFNDINFSVADLKALATKLFEGNKSKIYGRRYYGDYRSDGEFQDIRPEAFHKIAQEIIGKNHEAMVIDTDPGPEVWAEPIYQMTFIVKEDPEIKDAFLVTAWPRFVVYRNSSSDTLTNPMMDTSAKKYEYRLFIDRKRANDRGEFKVISGEWLNESLEFHPDFVFIPSKDFTPTNKIIGENRDILIELLKAAKTLP